MTIHVCSPAGFTHVATMTDPRACRFTRHWPGNGLTQIRGAAPLREVVCTDGGNTDPADRQTADCTVTQMTQPRKQRIVDGQVGGTGTVLPIQAVPTRALNGLPGWAAPAVVLVSVHKTTPTFGPGTQIDVQCGQDEKTELALTTADRWTLHALRYEDRPQDRKSFNPRARLFYYGGDNRAAAPPDIDQMSVRLTTAHSEAVDGRTRKPPA